MIRSGLSFMLPLWLALLASALGALSSRTSTDVVRFAIDLTSGEVDPTGAGPRKIILVNNSFPGPTLRLKVGQNVEFLVNNYLREDTTIHFHGIAQQISPWADGTPGVTQAAIKPGASFLYRWHASDHGVYFYHAHNRGQIMDGLYGSIVISADEQTERPFHLISHSLADQLAMKAAETELQPLLISDWSQFTFREFNNIQKSANIDYTCIDSIIVNGMGSQYCLSRDWLDELTDPLVRELLRTIGEPGITDKGCVPALQLFQGDFDLNLTALPPTAYKECKGGSSATNFTVEVSKESGWAALSLINPGGLYPLKVTIDNHKLHVYSVDGQYIFPQTIDQVVINNGNRIAFFVKLDQEVGQYTIRISNNLLGQVISGFALLNYEGAVGPAPTAFPRMDYGGRPIGNAELSTFSEANGHPFPPISLAATPDQTYKFLVKKLGRPYGAFEWTLSGISGYNMSAESLEPPFLFRHPNFVKPSELVIKTKRDQWIDLIFEVEGPFAQPHPMHKHGNKAFVLGKGTGSFPWSTVAEAAAVLPSGTFNSFNPPYRDGFTTIEGVNNSTWMVLRYKADHPGAWIFHCHIQTHLTGGMAIIILDGVDEFPQVPETYREWNGFDVPKVLIDGNGT